MHSGRGVCSHTPVCASADSFAAGSSGCGSRAEVIHAARGSPASGLWWPKSAHTWQYLILHSRLLNWAASVSARAQVMPGRAVHWRPLLVNLHARQGGGLVLRKHERPSACPGNKDSTCLRVLPSYARAAEQCDIQLHRVSAFWCHLIYACGL